MSDRGLTFETITSASSFTSLRSGWDDLVETMPRPSPFLLHDWLVEWWRHFGRGSELAVHTAFRDGHLVGAVPLYIRRRQGLRVAEFIGSYESALADLLVAEGEDVSVGERLAERVRSSSIDLVELFGLPGRSRVASLLGSELRFVERVEAPVLDVTAGWEDVYRARTTSKVRNFHRRRKRQLAELGRLGISVARTEPELVTALEGAFRLHAARWHGRPDTSTFGTTAGMAFHRAALRAISTKDVVRILTLTLDGRPIAFTYYFVLRRAMYLHRLAFDPALSRYSPGLVCTLAALEAACAEGAVRVEFLGGGERFKLELADRMEPLYEGFGLATSFRARAFVAGRLASMRLRLLAKRSAVLYRAYYRWSTPIRRLAIRLSTGPRRTTDDRPL